jgi:cysteine-rich repeat protein
LYLIPSTGVTYTARLIDSKSAVIAEDDFSPAPCQNLRTFGLAPELQAIVVLNHYRANNSLTPVFYNSLLETVASLIASGNVTQLGQAFILLGKSYDGTATSIDSQGTAFFDAGSLVQSLLLSQQLDTLSGEISEVGFSYSQTQESWVLVVGTRTRNICSDTFVAGQEECDDGNKVDDDGCSATCAIEPGWSCAEDILQEGSVCSRAPVDVPTTSPSNNNESPQSTPIAQNRGSVTKEAGTLALLLALIAVVLAF